jgi:ketosteroid isomerase-like protein
MAVIGGVAVLAVAAGLAYKFVLPRISSPEDQIRGVVTAFNNDYNNADFAGLMTLVCDQSKGDLGGLKALSVLKDLGEAEASDQLRQMRDEKGTATTSVTDIRVTGDRATATVTTTFSKSPSDSGSETDSFGKENGSWKICFPPDNSG